MSCPCPECNNDWGGKCLYERIEKAEALNAFFRDSVGECHVMISRDSSDYQIRKEWEPADLPPRLQKLIKRCHGAEALVKELIERDAVQSQMITELRRDCAKMLRRGMKACERQGWEKGESTEAWYHAAGNLAGHLELAEEMDADQARMRTKEQEHA